jgi:predicted nucleic acid-binding protein
LVLGAVKEAGRVATSTVAYAEARAALARKEKEGEFINEQHRRAVGALDVEWRGFVRLIVSNLVAYRAGRMAERYSLRGFDAVHLASAARLREEFVDLHFLAFEARFVAAARGSLVPVYERA